MTKILKIEGTNIELEIESCDSLYQKNAPDTPGCPCFDDGHGFEYGSQCQLTNEDGNLAYVHFGKPFILPGCPLPNKKKER